MQQVMSWGFRKLVFNLNAGSSGREGGEGLSYLVLPPTSNSSWRRIDDTNDIEFVICFEIYPYWYRSFTKMVSCADSDSHSFWWPIVIVIRFSHFSIIITNRLDIRQMHTFALNGLFFHCLLSGIYTQSTMSTLFDQFLLWFWYLLLV